MKTDLLQDAIGLVKEEYITEAFSKNKRTSKTVIIASAISLAACICIIAVWCLNSNKETAENIIWSDTKTKIEFSEDNGLVGNIDDNLNSAMKNATDDVYACVITSFDDYKLTADDYYRIEQLRQKLSDEESKLSIAAENCANDLVASKGISLAEAHMRIYTQPDFKKAREDYINAKKEYNYANLIAQSDIRKDEIEHLKSLGFKLLIDVSDEKYTAYFSAFHNVLGIFTATKDQILSLKDDTNYRLYGANKNAEKFTFGDYFSDFELELCEDCKLTKKLKEVYENNPEEEVTVNITFGYFGKEYTTQEIDALAYEAIGMTKEEFEQSATMEIVNRFTEIRNNLIWHADYYENLARKYLTNSEYIELTAYSGSATAKLTYKRALELCNYNDIAYISIKDEQTVGIYTDIKLGFDE